MIRGLFADKTVYRKFLILVFLVMITSLVFFMLSAVLIRNIYGLDVTGNPDALSNISDPSVAGALRLTQLIAAGFGMFIIPSLLAALLFSKQPSEYILTSRAPSIQQALVVLLIMFTAVPLINLLLSLNQQLALPGFLAGLENWMKMQEKNAEVVTNALLVMNTPGELFYNLIVIALIPAIGEELLFRGLLQRLFHELVGNIHVAIIITAILFSAIHIQFYGFFPRMLLGMLMGYLLFWTGNLWVPVIAHFINNAAAVIFAYLAGKEQLPFDHDTIGAGRDEIIITILSTIMMVLLLTYFKRISGKNTRMQPL